MMAVKFDRHFGGILAVKVGGILAVKVGGNFDGISAVQANLAKFSAEFQLLNLAELLVTFPLT